MEIHYQQGSKATQVFDSIFMHILILTNCMQDKSGVNESVPPMEVSTLQIVIHGSNIKDFFTEIC